MVEGQGSAELSFERAEIAGKAEEEAAICAFCETSIRNVYYQVGGGIACAACRGRLLAEREGGSRAGRFARAALFGVGAAILGALLWYAVARLTGYEFSLLAIGIGFLVGTAVSLGSRRRGGWAYQTLAMFLTYTSIVSTYVPAIYEAVAGYSESDSAAVDDGAGDMLAASAADADADERDAAAGEALDGGVSAASPIAASTASIAPSAPIGGLPGFIVGVTLLFGLAFIAPFLGGFSNFMGWIILAIGIYEAWKLNRKRELLFEGPFHLAGARPSYVPETPPPPIAP